MLGMSPVAYSSEFHCEQHATECLCCVLWLIVVNCTVNSMLRSACTVAALEYLLCCSCLYVSQRVCGMVNGDLVLPSGGLVVILFGFGLRHQFC